MFAEEFNNGDLVTHAQYAVIDRNGLVDPKVKYQVSLTGFPGSTIWPLEISRVSEC